MTPEETRIETLEQWLHGKPYWEQLVWMLCGQVDDFSDADAELCYKHLCREVEILEGDPLIQPSISFDNIYETGAAPTDTKAKVSIVGIKDMRHVNALSANCAPTFGPNLTLIYGKNGSGKSGIARLLANACFSRGSRDVLPDLKKMQESAEKASATFLMQTPGEAEPQNQPYEMGMYVPALKQFAVFDEQSVHIHLDKRNSVSFVPAHLVIFDRVAVAIGKMERRIAAETRLRSRPNPFVSIFVNAVEQSTLSEFCKGLTATVSDKQFLEAVAFTDNDARRLQELEHDIQNRRSLDIPAKIAQLAGEESALRAAHRTLRQCVDAMTPEAAPAMNQLLSRIHEQRTIVQSVGISSFNDDLFASVGSAAWKALLQAARAFYLVERQRAPSSADASHCVLCHQALGQQQKDLFQRYWMFLESEAEAELARLEERLRDCLAELRLVKDRFPPPGGSDFAAHVLRRHQPQFLAELEERFAALERVLDTWIAAIGEQRQVSSSDIPSIDVSLFATLAQEAKRERDALGDPSTTIAALEAEALLLRQRKVAFALTNEGLEHLRYIRWRSKINHINFAGIKAATTKKRTETFLGGIAQEYKAKFNSELAALGCEFDLVLWASGEQGNTVREYRLDFSEDHPPTHVLSEGEQTACSLADFLTEVQLDVNNCGIVLDDPVSSLDHERKERIAARLVTEARQRQVIIFTHDLAFMRKLVDAAFDNSIPFLPHWMRKVDGTPGHIALDSAPKLASTKTLKADAHAAVKDYSLLGPKAQERALGVALDYLRSACEALVEEYLFAKTIQRYDDHIRVQNLGEAIFDQELAGRIVDLHGKISEHILAHNRSDEARENGVDIRDFQSAMDAFEILRGDAENARRRAIRLREDRIRQDKEERRGW